MECKLENVAVKVTRCYGSQEAAHDLNGVARKLAKLQCEDSTSCRRIGDQVAVGVNWCGEFGGDVGDLRALVGEGVMGVVGLMVIPAIGGA